MCSESIKQRIADLRDQASHLRQCAAHAERYEDGFADRKRAKELADEADALEASLNATTQEHKQ